MFRRATINSQLHEAVEAYEKHGSQRIAAESLGIPLSTLRGRLKRAGAVSGNANSRIKKQEDVEKGSTTVTASGSTIRTVEELLEAAEIDLDEWELLEATVNAWGNDDNQNHQIKCRLRRRLPSSVVTAVDILEESLLRIPKSPPRKAATAAVDGKLLVFGLHDLHAAKLSWGEETGSDNYDLEIASKVFRSAVVDILAAVSHYRLDRAVLLIGSDLFHSNDSKDRTYNGTPLECDGRHAKVFAAVCELLVGAINTISAACPLDVLLCQGNHDHESSLYASHVLKAYYREDQRVDVDTTPTLRKYYEYGNNLLCFTHGHGIQVNSLPLVMATEAADAWGRCEYREAHIGHYHRAKEVRFLALDELNGVRIRVNPSLCPPDAWHAAKGFVQSRRAAEGHIYDKVGGYAATFSVNARCE